MNTTEKEPPRKTVTSIPCSGNVTVIICKVIRISILVSSFYLHHNNVRLVYNFHFYIKNEIGYLLKHSLH